MPVRWAPPRYRPDIPQSVGGERDGHHVWGGDRGPESFLAWAIDMAPLAEYMEESGIPAEQSRRMWKRTQDTVTRRQREPGGGGHEQTAATTSDGSCCGKSPFGRAGSRRRAGGGRAERREASARRRGALVGSVGGMEKKKRKQEPRGVLVQGTVLEGGQGTPGIFLERQQCGRWW